ncbi:MAG: branched-chain amino acid aminotransferase [Gemmatimonas sp.]
MLPQHFIDDSNGPRWVEGNPPQLGLMDNATWMSSVAFDGARAFDGVAPDLDAHAARLIRSARVIGLAPKLSADDIVARMRDGIARFPTGTHLYIRPLFYAAEGFVVPKPESTTFCLTLFESPLPDPKGFTSTLARVRRPHPDSAPTLAKAACLYPESAQAMREARDAGFGNAVMLDHLGNVAEFATANIFIVKRGTVITPIPNGSFLNGVTRQRVIALLRGAGVKVVERTVRWREVEGADEVFSSGNYAKVTPLVKLNERTLEPGPVYRKARELYLAWARTLPRIEGTRRN